MYSQLLLTRCLGNLSFAPEIPMDSVISVVSTISADAALNPLVCGCLSYLRHPCCFRDCRHFREGHLGANYRFGKPIGLEKPEDPKLCSNCDSP